MLVENIGEFDLIHLLEESIHDRNAAQIEKLRSLGVDLRLGIGDDAAVWTYPAATVVATTDTMVDGVHFASELIGWRDLGWKAAATNLSDIGAMGASPTCALVTLGLHGKIPVDGLLEMYGGIMDACAYAGGAIVGGDVVRSETFFVSVGLDGIVEAGGTPMTRSEARAGRAIAVTGTLGSSGGGLRLLLEDPPRAESVCADTSTLVDAHNHPMPRVREGQILRKLGVRCAMDISDGLIADLGKLCAASDVSARIDVERIPIDPQLRRAFPEDWLRLALGGGEDYELLFTADDATMATVCEQMGEAVSVVGRITGQIDRAGPSEPIVTVVDSAGCIVDTDSTGWDHFGNGR